MTTYRQPTAADLTVPSFQPLFGPLKPQGRHWFISGPVALGAAQVAVDGDEPVGICIIDPDDRSINLFVAAHRRQGGIGKALLVHTLDFARSKGMTGFTATTMPGLTGSAFAKQLGFIPVSVDTRTGEETYRIP